MKTIISHTYCNRPCTEKYNTFLSNNVVYMCFHCRIPVLKSRSPHSEEAITGSPDIPARGQPRWCTCLNCHEMATDLERKCCGSEPGQMCEQDGTHRTFLPGGGDFVPCPVYQKLNFAIGQPAQITRSTDMHHKDNMLFGSMEPWDKSQVVISRL